MVVEDKFRIKWHLWFHHDNKSHNKITNKLCQLHKRTLNSVNHVS